MRFTEEHDWSVETMTFSFQGYVVVDDFFDIDTDLEPSRQAIEEEIYYCANFFYNKGKIKSTCYLVYIYFSV